MSTHPIPNAQLPMRFDGPAYSPKHDQARLTGQMLRVFALMSDGRWRSLREISQAVHGSEAGVSARLRDLRKARFGAHTVNRRARGEREAGLYEYRLEVRR